VRHASPPGRAAAPFLPRYPRRELPSEPESYIITGHRVQRHDLGSKGSGGCWWSSCHPRYTRPARSGRSSSSRSPCSPSSSPLSLSSRWR